MTPYNVRQMARKLKEVGGRVYQGRPVVQSDGALIQDCADALLELLDIEEDRAKREAYAKAGRVPLQALFTPDDIAVMQGAAALNNPCGNDDAAVADSIAWIVGEWLSGQTEGYTHAEAPIQAAEDDRQRA